MKVYPGKRAGGVEADMMAANELNAHAFLQVTDVLFISSSLSYIFWHISADAYTMLTMLGVEWNLLAFKFYKMFFFWVHMDILQSSSKGVCTNLVLLVGGFETNTGEQVTTIFGI